MAHPAEPPSTATLSVSIADEDLLSLVAERTTDVDLVHWDMVGPPDRDFFDIVVTPHRPPWSRARRALEVGPRLIQLCYIGYEQWAEAALPAGTRIANAATAAERITAELAVTLMLAAQRGIPGFLAQQSAGTWNPTPTRSLLGARVLLVGTGGIGAAIQRFLVPFDVTLTRVARSAREDAFGAVHAVADLPMLVETADILVIAIPNTPDTRGLVDAALLSRLPDDALVVNVGRGPVVDTDALVTELQAGRLRAALDVVDPEPLAADHPLRHVGGALLTPHVGPITSAMLPRVADLIADQIARLQAGRGPRNVVLGEGRR